MQKSIPVLIFFIMACLNATAQQKIWINDSSAERGKMFYLPVYTDMDLDGVQTASVRIRYNALMLDLKNVSGGESYISFEIAPQFQNNLNLADLRSSELTVSTEFVNKVPFAPFCLLHFEVLAGPDSIAEVEPVGLEFNGSPAEGAEFGKGRISIDNPVFRVEEDYLSSPYPNPFFDKTSFDFYISEESFVDFTVYTTLGRRADRFSERIDNLRYLIRDSSGVTVEYTGAVKLPKGEYTLELEIKKESIASGAYYLFMTTDKGVYKSNFINMR